MTVGHVSGAAEVRSSFFKQLGVGERWKWIFTATGRAKVKGGNESCKCGLAVLAGASTSLAKIAIVTATRKRVTKLPYP